MTNSTQPQPRANSATSVLRRFVTPPVFPDEDKTRTARLLHAITMLLWPIYVVAIVITLIQAEDKLSSMVLNFILVLTLALTTYLLRSGRVKQASVVFITLQWLIVMAAVIAFGGLTSPTLSGLLLMTVIAGLLLGGRGAVFTALVTITALTFMLIAQTTGTLPPPIAPVTPLTLYINISLFLLLAAGLLYITTNSIDRALTATRRTAAALQQTNRELNSIRTSLEERIIERTEQLNVSADVARAVSSILDPDELLQRVTQLIVERFNLYYAAAFLVDDDAEFAVLREATGEAGRVLKERGHKLEITGPSMVGMAIATRQPRIVQDVDTQTMRFANPLLTETKSEVALPLIMGDQAIGALDVQSTRSAAFDESTVRVLQGLADQIAIAINNARQYQAAQVEARQATVLFEASRLGSFMGEGLDAIVQKLLHSVATEARFDSWLAATYDPDADAMTVIGSYDPAHTHRSTPMGQALKLSEHSKNPITTSIRARSTISITDPENDPRVAHVPPAERGKLHLICVPALLGERVLGAVSLGRATSEFKISAREIRLAEAVAAQFAIAIENRRLLEQSQKSVEEMNRLMRLYMHEGWSSFSHTRSADRLRQEYNRPNAPELKPEVLAQIDEAVNQATTANDGKPISIDGQSVVSVPIELRGEVFGALTMHDTSDRQWTEDELATLQAVAAQVAQSLESARLLQESETSLQETMGLYQASRGIAAAQTPSEVLQSISDSIIIPEIDRIVLALVIPDSPKDNLTAEVAAAWERGVETPEILGNRWAAAQIPLIGPHLVEPLVAHDVATATNLDPVTRHFFANVIKVKSLAVLPLQAGGDLLGWLMIETLRQKYNFGDSEIRRYRTLAGQAAVALENRRLFLDVQDRVNQLTILTRIGRRLASTLDLDEILSSVIDESFNATDATQGGIFLYNEQQNALELRVMRGFGAEMESRYMGYIVQPGQGLVGRVLETGESLLINDVSLEPAYQVIDARTRAELILPIRQGSLLLGVLNLESPQVNGFRESDQHLLEAMADQAAVAITNARAYEAEREAVERIREVDRLKTQFLANMSHELRTPLNSIIGFSRVMLRGIDGPLTEMQSTDLTSIYNSGQHLLGLINNILDIAKIEAGKMELSIEPVNLNDIAKTIMSTAIALVKDKHVKLEQDLPADLPIVMADQTRVRQIILNLVSNAAKFTEKGFVRLRMVSTPKEVLISVMDSGIGIPPDKIEHIFEEFTQVDASTTRKYGGTGLGLAITRKFVDMHKGRIWVESEMGLGSTFTFTLPREQAEPESSVSLPSDLEARGAGKKLVMCIDDDPGVITLYKRYLEKQDYLVIGVTDPTKAIDEARRLLPYAITLDVMMPRKDGWDVLADLKKTPEVSHTPILVCSIVQDKSRGFSLGAADYLVKPITEDELRKALERINRDKTINKILVVDDEPSALMLLKRILESQPQYKVLDAAGGAQALTIVESDKPDLVLLDLMMPEIDGFTVLDKIKANPDTHDIPVIIVTAKEITAEDRARLNGHMTALYNKGMFTAEQLLDDIGQALANMNTEIAREGKKVEVFHKTTT